ncbi:MAG TPA: DUF2167 domain-containing protein [Noviherbaspirillum sp.]|nr:DUF2167 domain-containing protein [Noviherbaspirillum sp.]
MVSALARATLGVCCAFILGLSPAMAEPEKSPEDLKVEALFKENDHLLVYGPASVTLGDQAQMTLQRGQAFVPPELTKQAFKIFKADSKPEGLMGMVVPGLPGDEKVEDDWGAVVLVYTPLGFVRDEDAKSWQFDKLLANIRASTEKDNAQKRASGRPEQEVTGWVETPHYDANTHRLLWSIRYQEKAKLESAYVAYNTTALGRYGMLQFIFVTEAEKISLRKDLAAQLLNTIHFNPGKRYQDYAEGTDKVAEIGLAALIGGVAAKKLGLFAVLLGVLVKWGKLIAGAVAGGVLLLKFRKKKNSA